jgi:hypothetical protein
MHDVVERSSVRADEGDERPVVRVPQCDEVHAEPVVRQPEQAPCQVAVDDARVGAADPEIGGGEPPC